MVQGLVIDAGEHPIKAVTIFKSNRAEIVRTFNVDLKVGQNKIEIFGLSSSVDFDSVRVTGLGDARLFDVTCTWDPKKNRSSAAPNNQARIRALRTEQQALQAEKRMREKEAKMLSGYADTLSSEHVAPLDAVKYMEAFMQRSKLNLAAVLELDGKIQQVEEEIKLETERHRERKGSTDARVTMVIGADHDGPAHLKLTYISTNTWWNSTYDLYATTENGQPGTSVTLKYRARVTQSTGEDWTDAAIVLSTATSDTFAKGIPALPSWRVTPVYRAPSPPFPPPPGALPPSVIRPMVRLSARKTSMATATAEANEESDDDMGFAIFDDDMAGGGDREREHERRAMMTEPGTIVSESALSLSYAVEGKSSIPSDGESHQVSIASLTFEAKTSYVAVPRVEPVVYLSCAVKNISDYRLLSGPVSVFMDDSFVSKTSIQARIRNVDAGDTFHCTFGPDPAVRITYVRDSTTKQGQGGAFIERHNSTTYTTKIAVTNKHKFAAKDVVVRDAIPLAADDFKGRAKVILSKPEGLAEAEAGQEVAAAFGKVRWAPEGGEKEGRFEWACDVEAGQEVTLETKFEIRAPSDMEWNLTS
ncbi:hypothetical protein PUNSTDRAFT_102081 [Punctularia strigosozonata HHB-11173 SS5]|uniref:uncharacterized protein n=1 Tax=Punctularia strigosozonata (strain HHB-11173) TaxID=741275 RepID=UPI0004417C97|nr:uncharacterized protein PUNSTDRAFT_102081 [Punctularia strigosozonata HHB-11173 SS5]EIN10081.1 hypothetical protein PUNSTDRAFT_102081 [Punctularia strigosozonata HHB-11173 SS5]